MTTRRISPQGDNEGGFGRLLKRWAEGHFVKLFSSEQTLVDLSTSPDSPASGYLKIFAKAGKIYTKTAAGVEQLIGLALGTTAGTAAEGNHNHDTVYAPYGIHGVISGGSSGQVLAKNSTTDYDLKWFTIPAGGPAFQGMIDCSGSPNYPSCLAGGYYVVSVAGKIGGASGIDVEIGDMLWCLVDSVGGTQAAVGSDWNPSQANLSGAQLATAYAHAISAHAPTNAEQNVQGNWTETNSALDSYILNKPTLGTAAAKNYGTAVGDLVEVQTGGKLPALDGSLLTGLPSGVGLGETETTAYRGDRGKTAYDHSQMAHAPSNANYYVHPNHSGDVTSVADGSQTIIAKAVTLEKMADLTAYTIIGNNTASAATPIALTKQQVLNLLNVADGAQPCNAITKSEIEAKLTGEISSHSHAGAAGSTVRVSSNDSTPGYLLNKLVAGSGIVLTETNDGGNEGVIITSTGGSGSGSYNYIVQRSIEGLVYETTFLYYIVPAASTLTGVNVYLSTIPTETGKYVKVNVLKNGVATTDSIFNSYAPISTSPGDSPDSRGKYRYTKGVSDMISSSLAAGDLLLIKVETADIGGTDLIVQLVFNVGSALFDGGAVARLSLFQARRDTAANWSSGNPVLANGEPVIDTTNSRLYIGDGTNGINSLFPIGEREMVRGAEGQIYVGQVFLFDRVQIPCKIKEVSASLATQPSGQNAWIDIRKNGTAVSDSIFASSAAISITTSQSAVNGLYSATGTLDSSKISLAVGDVLYVMVTQISSSYSGSDLLVKVRTS